MNSPAIPTRPVVGTVSAASLTAGERTDFAFSGERAVRQDSFDPAA